jgi:hypothetical protein
MNTCSSCYKPIIWGRLPSGKSIPLDPDPVETGNLAVRPPGAQVRYLKRSDVTEADEWRAVSHFATCLNAKQHRKSR